MTSPISQIVRRLHRKIMVSMRAVAADEDDTLAAAATTKLADLYEAQLAWVEHGRDIDDAIHTSHTIARNPHIRVIASTAPPPPAKEPPE